ncbi:hypothetical protein L2E82_31436 [Cichorium intybus]|uniref:Uncharacterized protein n=1 Tax=Cichorium intybus TaxID=13427 RepID=A0ACB9D3B3_CICIN|nr:hypothetical protein L2E82_31436 [Cichorium intybus]
MRGDLQECVRIGVHHLGNIRQVQKGEDEDNQRRRFAVDDDDARQIRISLYCPWALILPSLVNQSDTTISTKCYTVIMAEYGMELHSEPCTVTYEPVTTIHGVDFNFITDDDTSSEGE